MLLCMGSRLSAQVIGVKSNLLYDATSSINLGAEVGLAEKWTLDISGTINPWNFSNDHKMKFWLVQPELKYWTCKRFQGNFFSLEGHYSQFNVNYITLIGKELDYRNEGWLAGVGIGFGHQWIIGDYWSLEGEIAVGYSHIEYDKYPCVHCGNIISSDHKDYVGPTKAAVSLIYLIK